MKINKIEGRWAQKLQEWAKINKCASTNDSIPPNKSILCSALEPFYTFYLRTILKDLVALFVAVFFEVTTTVAIHNSPDLRLSIFIVFTPAEVDIELVQILTLSLSLFTDKSMVAPSFGKVDDILTIVVCDEANAA